MTTEATSASHVHHPMFAFLFAALLSACAAPVELPPVPFYDAPSLAGTHWKAVLVAGDATLPVFDNAVQRWQTRLRNDIDMRAIDLQRLSAAPAAITQTGVRSASLDHVLGAIRDMKPTTGQGCFVYVTSHGAIYRGITLSLTGEVLTPDALDRALAVGCGNAPTVAVISGCYTGAFAQAPMARANRVVLTAAQANRPSFGCGAEYTYTVFDRCLLGATEQGGDWKRAYAAVQACVGEEEHKGRFRPSKPQAYFGPAVGGVPVPARTGQTGE